MNVFQKIKRRVLWMVFSLLPKDQDKVMLQSFYGRGFSDSSKAIAEELMKRGGYKLYWTVRDKASADSIPEGITPVIIDTASSIYHFCTSGFWIDNCRKWAYVKKRANQYYVQAWHGFPLKKIEKDAADALEPWYVEGAKYDSSMCDLYLSNSKFLTDIYHSAFWYDGEVLEMGLPRNDMLTNPAPHTAEKVADALSLPSGCRYMLYAPTFRRDYGMEVYDVDYERCTSALTERFGGRWIVLAKLHPNVAARAGELNLDPQFVINASDYPDIHDLYIACDAMISDYSSTMFDFSITGKPCFLYVNDLEAYKNDRNFYFDINRLPFARATDNDELCRIIHDFDETVQKKRCEEFISDFGINETGRASEVLADKMDKIKELRKGKKSK